MISYDCIKTLIDEFRVIGLDMDIDKERRVAAIQAMSALINVIKTENPA